MVNQDIIENGQVIKYRHYLQLVIEGSFNSCICQSRAGLGKTHTTLQILDDENAEYYYTTTYSSPLALYKMLYENNGKIIVLDDMEMILNNPISVSILKSALWGVKGKREVAFTTTSNKLDYIPQKFDFTGRIIMLVNEIKAKRTPTFDALITRTLNIKLTYSFEETKEMAISIVNKNVQDGHIRAKVLDIIERRIAPFHDFNFRYLDHLIKMVRSKPDYAEELFMEAFNVDEDYQIIWELIQAKYTAEKQIQLFKTKTGKGRTTYYRIRKRIKGDYGI